MYFVAAVLAILPACSMQPAIMRSAAWAPRCADTAPRFATIHSTCWSVPCLQQFGELSSVSDDPGWIDTERAVMQEVDAAIALSDRQGKLA
jgi:hypothetical protein